MSFIQVIEFRTSKVDEVRAAGDEYAKATEGRNKVRRQLVAEDRDNPGRYFLVVAFDSYEDAMQNSAMPETDAVAKKMAALTDGAPIFYNLNVLEERSF